MHPLVVLISIDGMRPDAMLAAEAPTLERLARTGRSCLTAQTVMPSVTLPCHTSMFRGVDVPRHGITTNTFMPLARPVPSFVDVAAQRDRRCGAFFNWGPLRDLYDPESVAVSVYVRDAHRPEGDRRVTDGFLAHHHDLDFAFIYLGHTDERGHMAGWMSEEYLHAIHVADQCVADILAIDRPVIGIVQSDHGGHDRSHGTEMPEDMTIPWILFGPEIAAEEIQGVRIFDTCPTLADALGVPRHPYWEGTSHWPGAQ